MPDDGGNHMSILCCTNRSSDCISLSHTLFQPGKQRTHCGLSGNANPSSIRSHRISCSSWTSTYFQGTFPDRLSQMTKNWSSISWGKTRLKHSGPCRTAPLVPSSLRATASIMSYDFGSPYPYCGVTFFLSPHLPAFFFSTSSHRVVHESIDAGENNISLISSIISAIMATCSAGKGSLKFTALVPTRNASKSEQTGITRPYSS
mmetsp:Transcript_2678/g.7863  ORF Transcript_2678/g.7863 Transcript_2678/m.7863 type:complete len:204 (-) Transcript_2678:426-1037(-)